MPWSIDYLPEEKVLNIINIGELTFEDYAAQAEEAIQMVKEHDIQLILSDNSENKTRSDVLDIYEMPRLYQKLGGKRSTKVAVVVSRYADKGQSYKFYETVCQNEGWSVRLFGDRAEAMKWLINN